MFLNLLITSCTYAFLFIFCSTRFVNMANLFLTSCQVFTINFIKAALILKAFIWKWYLHILVTVDWPSKHTGEQGFMPIFDIHTKIVNDRVDSSALSDTPSSMRDSGGSGSLTASCPVQSWRPLCSFFLGDLSFLIQVPLDCRLWLGQASKLKNRF